MFKFLTLAILLAAAGVVQAESATSLDSLVTEDGEILGYRPSCVDNPNDACKNASLSSANEILKINVSCANYKDPQCAQLARKFEMHLVIEVSIRTNSYEEQTQALRGLRELMQDNGIREIALTPRNNSFLEGAGYMYINPNQENSIEAIRKLIKQ